jgi:hypothetical protein
MNEAAQLDAMAAELVAAGYEVSRDVPGGQLGLDLSAQSPLHKITLDLVARLRDTSSEAGERPHLVIVEVANRTRLVQRDGGAAARRTFVEEDEAVSRFRSISEGVAQHPAVVFQIRFFDVSADQFAARRMRKGFRAKQSIIERVQESQRLLARSAARDHLSRALVVARLWAHWLRIAGNLHPGRDHQEFRVADLRTIQKDLFDQQVLQMSPSRYGTLHRSLLAASEGGDFEPRDLLLLEPHVRALLKWAAARYDVPGAEEEPETGSLFQRLIKDIEARTSGPRQEELRGAVVEMWLAHDTDVFAKKVAGFLLALRGGPEIAQDLMTELLEQASQ